MIRCLTHAVAFYLGGVAIQAAQYTVWMCCNPGLGPHWITVENILMWPVNWTAAVIAYW